MKQGKRKPLKNAHPKKRHVPASRGVLLGSRPTKKLAAAAPKYQSNVEVFSVNKADSGKPLQDFLSARLGLSRRAAKAIVDGRNVWVNRRCVWIAHHPLKTGDSVELPRAVAVAARRQVGSACNVIVPQERQHVRVLLETEHYIVADKPAGLLTCDDPKSVESILREQLKEPTLEAVHRLDRDTTGCLLFSKNYAAKLAAIEIFKTRKVTKIYHAIVAGAFTHVREVIDKELDGKPAVSHVTREAVSPDASMLRVRIETGRTNQIRRHLSGIGAPIIGDKTFGLKSARDVRLVTVPRQMLHASTLTLPNPVIPHEEIKAHSPLPADFRAALKIFGMGKKK